MASEYSPSRWPSRIKPGKWVGAAICALIGIFCVLYIIHTYAYLVSWFRGLNPCFYHARGWSDDFFTPGIKSDGNMYASIGLCIALAGIYFSVRKSQETIATKRERLPVALKHDLPIAIILWIVSLATWWWGNLQALPAHDEVFSAENAAGIHPFQCIAYYMLPNNHLLFNLLNHVAGFAATDRVVSGRILSLLVYMMLVTTLYLFFKRPVGNRWLAGLMSAVLSQQFFTWGFAFQARGYELYLLAGWGLAISLFAYTQTHRRLWLSVNAACIITGYFCMPSFLYLHAAEVVFLIFYTLRDRQTFKEILTYQSLALAGVFLCYLPALCFSGLESLVRNSYVLPMQGCKTVSAFWQWGYGFFLPYIGHLFSDLQISGTPVSGILFLAPILLLADRKNAYSRMAGGFYIVMWVTFFLIATIMNRLPFERNLIAQYSISLAALLWLLYRMLSALPKTFAGRCFQAGVFTALLMYTLIRFELTNAKYLVSTLYEANINQSYRKIDAGMSHLPAGASVSFSDRAFYCRYIYNKQGHSAGKCPEMTTDYLVKEGGEDLPDEIMAHYEKVDEGDEYQVYRRRH